MYLLGIDIGTSSVKTLVFEAHSGTALASATQEYPVHQPKPGHAEQNPDDWWHAAAQTVRRAVETARIAPDSIAGIGLSGQMHGVVCLNQRHEPVRPAIIWADTRSKPQVEMLLKKRDRWAGIAPGPPAAGFMGPTLMWLHEHEPETVQQTAVILLPKDYIRLRLTGEQGTDVSDAAASWLLDVRTGQWSQALLDLCALETRYLPAVNHSTEVIGRVIPEAGQMLGVPAGIPVVAGCADQPAQALGYGLYQPGTALVTIGTGGQVFMPLTQPLPDPQTRFYVFNHAIKERWYAAAAILAAGLALRWLRNTLGLEYQPDAYAHLSELAADTPPGAEGLVFLPYLAGERTPHFDPLASGVFLGLRLHHHTGHLARAVMEGVTFALRDCLALVSESARPERVIISGGAVNSPVWRQIQADMFNQPVWLAKGEHHACVGAALLAGVGCGVYETMDEAARLLPQVDTPVEPDPKTADFYAARGEIYRGLYTRLRDDMHRLSAL